jgi:hypothetical protein
MKIEPVAETPCPQHLRRGRRGSWWTVAVTVPPALPAAAVTRRAETAMRAVAALPGLALRRLAAAPGPGPARVSPMSSDPDDAPAPAPGMLGQWTR